MVGSFCCAVEANTALISSCTPIKINFKKRIEPSQSGGSSSVCLILCVCPFNFKDSWVLAGSRLKSSLGRRVDEPGLDLTQSY